MKLESKTSSQSTVNSYRIITESHGPIVYLEYLNEKGHIIDEILRDEDGNDISDPALLEDVQEFIDAETEEQRRDEKNGLYPTKADVAN